jgi:hypothetical protein
MLVALGRTNHDCIARFQLIAGSLSRRQNPFVKCFRDFLRSNCKSRFRRSCRGNLGGDGCRQLRRFPGKSIGDICDAKC